MNPLEDAFAMIEDLIMTSGCAKSKRLRTVADVEKILGREVSIGEKVLGGLELKDCGIAKMFWSKCPLSPQ